MSTAWFLTPRKPRARARLRLFCFPYAGGGPAVFRTWPAHLAPDVEILPVQLPGRAARLREKPFGKLVSLAPALAQAMEPLVDVPYAFFGHSLGALIAFETARDLRRRGLPSPIRLFVAGRRGPGLKDPGERIHDLPDGAFVEAVNRRYGGVPASVLEEPEVLRLLLPSLRGDLEMLETYEFLAGEPLECPIVALAGRDDPHGSPAEMAPWGQETRASFELHEFSGGHFFIREAEAQVASLVRAELAVGDRAPARPDSANGVGGVA